MSALSRQQAPAVQAAYISPAERERRAKIAREDQVAAKARMERETEDAERLPYERVMALLSELRQAGNPGGCYVEKAVLLTPREARHWPQDKIFDGRETFDLARSYPRAPSGYHYAYRQKWKKDRREFLSMRAKYFTNEERRSNEAHLKYGVTSVVRGWREVWEGSAMGSSDRLYQYRDTVTITEEALFTTEEPVASWDNPTTLAFKEDGFKPLSAEILRPGLSQTEHIISRLEKALLST